MRLNVEILERRENPADPLPGDPFAPPPPASPPPPPPPPAEGGQPPAPPPVIW